MINQIELSEKFKEIFVDEETTEYFHKWHDEKLKKEDKRTWLQKNILFLIAITIPFIVAVIFYHSFCKDRIDQRPTKFDYDNDTFITFVRHEGEIVATYWVPMNKLTDSIKKAHREAGEALLKTLNKP